MIRTVCQIALVVVLCAAGAVAQETTTGSIAGRVVDTQGLVVPGATVDVQSAQGVKTFTTDADGRFVAPFLTPGMHSIRVSLEGFRTVERGQIDLRLGQHLEMTFTLQAGIAAEVTVVGAAPVVATTSTTAETSISSSGLSQLPVNRRMTDVLYLAPGVSESGGSGKANASISGGTGLENNYNVDGVNITNAAYGAVGSYHVTFGSLGSGIPYDFIDQVQVKTAGVSAEYGEATGGMVNVVTRSGGNAFKGSLFGYLQTKGMESAWREVQLPNGAVNKVGSSASDAGAVVGGPVLQNRIFFLLAINPSWSRVGQIAPQGFALRPLGEVDQDRRSLSYASKVTVELGRSHRLDVSAFGDPSRGADGPQRPTALLGVNKAAFSSIDYGGHQQAIRHAWILSTTWFLESSITRSTNHVNETPEMDEWSITDTRVVPNIRSGGVGSYNPETSGSITQYATKGTNELGRHQLRYGFSYQDISYQELPARTGPSVTFADGLQSAGGVMLQIRTDPRIGTFYRVTSSGVGGTLVKATQDFYAGFIQDTWRIGSRLTLAPGLRWEQKSIHGMRSSYSFPGGWAPRLGATFDPTGKAHSKVYGHWGRFYNKMPNNTALRVLSSFPLINRADFYDAALTQPIPDGVAVGGVTAHYTTSNATPSVVDPGSKEGYQDEWVAGAEYEIGKGVNIGIRYTHRSLKRVFEDVGKTSMVWFAAGLISSNVMQLTNPRQGYPLTTDGASSHDDPIRDYDAVEVTAQKRFANRWSLLASYRWSRLWGDFEGYYDNDAGGGTPGFTTAFDYPYNDPLFATVGAEKYGFKGDIRYLGRLGAGPLTTDRTHVAKLFGNYNVTPNLNVGLGASASSGTPLWRRTSGWISLGIPYSPRGTGLPTVDGFKKRTPAVYNVDLNVSYWKSIGHGRRLGLLVDAFNILDSQSAVGYVNRDTITWGLANPDVGRANAYQAPRRLRTGVRIEF